ncbi:hypothetical protein JAO10_13925 [Burkholderia contaminans]|uniref:Uncharacterized protein n=1 Tax=Burkholderia contaminans TaxID=488447 RepID=A0AAP1Y909_9BURK|nr:hypothetical protein [Burkholderia contaminans]MBH9667283.1 hypothetical protein [Burkholderia contaminans]MBH9673168.1 hypothetical protein [Burkholderia contaminans]MBH9689409.1 hypothetical protein [Burkholderia contaminans]MBH9703211.1 hypothetical protein [Burkholderia contaminans]
MHIHERYFLWIGEMVVNPAVTPLPAVSGMQRKAGRSEERSAGRVVTRSLRGGGCRACGLRFLCRVVVADRATGGGTHCPVVPRDMAGDAAHGCTLQAPRRKSGDRCGHQREAGDRYRKKFHCLSP